MRYEFDPLETLRFGNVEATIWKNDGDVRNSFIVKISRVQWAKDEWRHSILYRLEDLQNLEKAAAAAAAWIARQRGGSLG